jgi:acyl carrier protein
MSKTKEKIAKILGCNTADLSASCKAGSHHLWDSLGQVKVLLWLEAEYGLNIDDEAIEKLTTVQEIERFVDGN